MKRAANGPAEPDGSEPCCSSYDSSQHKRLRHASSEKQKVFAKAGIPASTNVRAVRFPERFSPPVRGDDKDGHYIFELGDNISSRFKILSKIGEGTFGRVLECWDRKHRDYVAIKIVRNVEKYRVAAMIELEVLHTLFKYDVGRRRHCIPLREWFDYRGHVCMVFEKLGPSLYDYVRRNEYQGFPIDHVQSIARQLLEAVAYMHEHRLVHTDLKPENILLLSGDSNVVGSTSSKNGRKVPKSSAIAVIDFGSATFEDAYHSTIVSTRHYRAPEVILGLGWSYAADIWSVGCILVELLTGDALFQTHENLEHLAMMERVVGKLPDTMTRACKNEVAKHFSPTGELRWPDKATRKSIRAVQQLQPVDSLLMNKLTTSQPSAALLDAAAADPAGSSDGSVTAAHEADIRRLADLVGCMLRYKPEDRVMARAALAHPFFGSDLGGGDQERSSDTSLQY